MTARSRPGAVRAAWFFLLFVLFAISLAIFLLSSGSCLAEPACGDPGAVPASEYGYMPPCEPVQPPGPVKDMGSIPGPCTWGQAAVGILLPGLIGLAIALLLNLSGSRAGAVPPLQAAPAGTPWAAGPGPGSPPPPVHPLRDAAAPSKEDVPPGHVEEGAKAKREWDRAKAKKAFEFMQEAVQAFSESVETSEPAGGVPAGGLGGAGGHTDPMAKSAMEIAGIGSGVRALLDRIASNIKSGEDLQQTRGREEIPGYMENLQSLEAPEGHIDRTLSETKQALSQTERSIMRLDARFGPGQPEGMAATGPEDITPGREVVGFSGEISGEADAAAKEYLEYLAMRRDLKIKEAAFEYRKNRGKPAVKEGKDG